jgi:hypothetical protein
MPSNPPTGRAGRLVAAGYLALAAAFVGAVALPYARAADAARADIRRLQADIAARRNKTRQLADMDGRIQLIDLQTRNFDRLVPATQDLGPFLSELSRELDAVGMHDISVSTMPPTALGKSQRQPIELHGKGTFAQFHDFLVRLEHLQRLCSVGKLTVEADTDMSGYVTAQMTLYIYNTKSGA